jgi:hypothetical protein
MMKAMSRYSPTGNLLSRAAYGQWRTICAVATALLITLWWLGDN